MPLTYDAWAAALLFCDGRTAVLCRGVAPVLRDAVDLACCMGLAAVLDRLAPRARRLWA